MPNVIAGHGATDGVSQHSIAKGPARLFEEAEGCGTHRSVDREAAGLLKSPHRQQHGVVEQIVRGVLGGDHGLAQKPDTGQAHAHLGHGGATIPEVHALGMSPA